MFSLKQLLEACSAAAIAMVLFAPNASADLTVQPELSTRAEYEKNPRIRVAPRPSVLVTKNLAGFEAIYARPTYSISLEPRARVSRYTEETELNSEDYFVTLAASKLFEKQQLSGQFAYEREATITTELLDSGLFNVNVPRTTLSFNGSWQYAFTDRLNTTVFGNALDVSFEPDPRSTFIDYNQFGLGTSLSYVASDRTTLIGTFSVSEFKTPQTSSDTRSYSFQFGFDHLFSESLEATFRIGHNRSQINFKSPQTELISLVPFRVETTIVDQIETASGEIINLGLTKEFERAKMKFEWVRSFSPSSQGIRQRSQNVYAFARYRLTELLDVGTQVYYRERNQEGQLIAQRLGSLREFSVVSNLRYRFSPLFSGEVGIRYRQQERLNVGSKADAEQAYIALRYTPERVQFRK